MEDTMTKNLREKTGKSLEEWIKIAEKSGFKKHGEIVKYLKTEHEFTHGYANLVAHKMLASDAGSVEDQAQLIEDQYAGDKAALRPIYNQLIKEIHKFGKDVEIAPKKAYVSVRRKKQFAILQPSTKTRFDLGLNLKGKATTARLEASGSFNAMCSHRIRVEKAAEVDQELINWVKEAYDAAG
ncbi:MAG: DUF4287 domain-containing protein [Calditrichaeota bacterium]|nr:DUF4287 domain-containing protein [Calditrichota bacterium]